MITKLEALVICCLVLGCGRPLRAGDRASVALIVSDPFGARFKSVRLVHFSAQGGGGADLAQQFRNLEATSIPYGSYLAELQADQVKIAEHVTVDRPVVDRKSVV